MKKKIVFLSLLAVALLASCTSYKKVPYLQNSNEWDGTGQAVNVYEPRIQPFDLLNILVSSPENPASSIAYNLISPSDNSRMQSLQSQPTLHNYLVDADGCVVIPNVGKLNIGGLTISEAEQLVLEKARGGFASLPVVALRFVDFKVSVLGEVTSPGTYTIKNGKVNIFEALALARDMTIYGQRENVKIIREDNTGRKEVVELDLNDTSILNSPYYYLQQNDVVYVTPNKSKSKNSDIGSSTSLWFSGTSIFISLISLLYNILN